MGFLADRRAWQLGKSKSPLPPFSKGGTAWEFWNRHGDGLRAANRSGGFASAYFAAATLAGAAKGFTPRAS